jgi:hypothetical protein
VFNITTITFGNFFNTNCDIVDYLTAHIPSYLVAGLNGLVLSVPLPFMASSEKSFP